MEMTGDILIAAERPKVWDAINSESILLRCIPGCESVEKLSETEKLVRVLVKVGPVRARFVGKINLDQIRPNLGCILNFEGSGGAAGMASGRSVIELKDEGQQTRLSYTAQASVGGKLGQIGGRMMDAASKQMADQFFSALNREIGATETASITAASSAAKFQQNLMDKTSTSVQQNQTGTSHPEWIRVLWFALGAASTALGVLLASGIN